MSVIKPRTATVTIFTGDHLDRIRHLERQHAAAVTAEDDGLTRLASDVPQSVELAEKHREAVDAAEADAIHVVVTALPRKVWRALVAEHPVRDGNRDDIAAGVNEDTFKDALVLGGQVLINGHPTAYASVLSPELTEADFDEMADVDYDRIYYAAFGLNRSPSSDPKALASRSSRRNAAT